MNLKSITRAAIVCVFVALIAPFLAGLLFGTSIEYDAPVDPDWFNSASIEEQQIWMENHSRTLKGLDFVISRIKTKHFWLGFGPQFAMMFGLLFISCLLFWYWDRGRAHSNKALQSAPAKASAAPSLRDGR